MRTSIFLVLFVLLTGCVALALLWSGVWLAVALVLILLGIAMFDATQRRHSILRNFPLLGRVRYLFEMIRPEIQQYFVEADTDGLPFNRERRSVVYQRAKKAMDTLPFGTQLDVYAPGYEWISHSFMAKHPSATAPRVLIGGDTCKQPYSSSLLNIAAMSYGSLSANAVEALNRGARDGGFAQNTGEGGAAPFHLNPGGDLIWQIGTGYFGCRDADGKFDQEKFQEAAKHPSIKMIEIKLSQGAKPGHGGILPGAKVTEEIAEIRGVPIGKDVLSPPTHSAFRTPVEMLHWIEKLRKLSGGKPVGFKLCVGRMDEFMVLCMAMRSSGKHPDFIVVDGGEGGTGAAPLEFSNSVGMPLNEGLVFVHNCLVGFALRERIKIIASGKVITGFDMVTKLALGADLCYSARAMMMAIGCIQARRCNANDCPAGVATQKKSLMQGLDVDDKAPRVHSYHEETIQSLLELVGASGLDAPSEITPHHIMRRVQGTVVRSYFDLYPFIERGALIADPVPEAYEEVWRRASRNQFETSMDSLS
ncbi:MAG: glutamate synthase domain-containing protein 2 [Glaciecola sp.]|jgi:glutamate synthase domain-containing protein 2